MNFNPADYFVNTLAIVPGEEEESKTRVKVRTLLRKGCLRCYNFNDFLQYYLDAPNYRIVDLSFLQWRIQGRDPPPLFLKQTEAPKGRKKMFGHTPPPPPSSLI